MKKLCIGHAKLFHFADLMQLFNNASFEQSNAHSSFENQQNNPFVSGHAMSVKQIISIRLSEFVAICSMGQKTGQLMIL
jgi:hypothetical protein